MAGQDSQNLDSLVPVYDVVPHEWQEARQFLVEQLKRITNAVNYRATGWLLDTELLAGKYFIPGENIVVNDGTSEQYRTVLRYVANTGALPNTGFTSTSTPIVQDENFTLIGLQLVATDPNSSPATAFALSYWDNTGTAPITVDLEDGNVIITTTANYSNFTRSYAIIEYMTEL